MEEPEFVYLLRRGTILKCQVIERRPTVGWSRQGQIMVVAWPEECSPYEVYSWKQNAWLKGKFAAIYQGQQPIYTSFEEAREAFLQHTAKKLKALEHKLLHDRMKFDLATELGEAELAAKGVVKVCQEGKPCSVAE